MRTCVVLGAGASLANALHFRPRRQRHTRPPLDTTFFDVVAARGIGLTAPLSQYLQDELALMPEELGGQRMEGIFAEAFYDFVENPQRRLYLNGYIDLVDLYLRVIRETTNWLNDDSRRGAPVGRLLAAAAGLADKLDIITFNHDLVIENEIEKRAQLRHRWCVDQGYGTMSSDLEVLVPTGSVPVFPLHNQGQCDHDRPIRLLKLHGSLNWFARINSERPTAPLLTGQRSIQPQLLIRREIGERHFFQRQGRGRGRQRWRLWPLIVPPVYAKQALRGSMRAAWTDARDALQSADRVIVFGYSLRAVDLEAEKTFERAVGRNAAVEWIDIVNPDPGSASRFANVSSGKPVR